MNAGVRALPRCPRTMHPAHQIGWPDRSGCVRCMIRRSAGEGTRLRYIITQNLVLAILRSPSHSTPCKSSDTRARHACTRHMLRPMPRPKVPTSPSPRDNPARPQPVALVSLALTYHTWSIDTPWPTTRPNHIAEPRQGSDGQILEEYVPRRSHIQHLPRLRLARVGSGVARKVRTLSCGRGRGTRGRTVHVPGRAARGSGAGIRSLLGTAGRWRSRLAVQVLCAAFSICAGQYHS